MNGPPARVAVARDKSALGDSANLLSQAGKIVNESAADKTWRRLAEAA